MMWSVTVGFRYTANSNFSGDVQKINPVVMFLFDCEVEIGG